MEVRRAPSRQAVCLSPSRFFSVTAGLGLSRMTACARTLAPIATCRSSSVAVGEHGLRPSVRQADKDTLIIADGFSGREQIA